MNKYAKVLLVAKKGKLLISIKNARLAKDATAVKRLLHRLEIVELKLKEVNEVES